MGRILFIDDDFDALETYTKAVSLADHYAEVAASAEEAWEKIRSAKFDLIFVDLNLPGKSGLELLKELDAEDITSSTAVIVISALPEKELIDDVIQAGALMFIAKPIALVDLLDVIDKFDGE